MTKDRNWYRVVGLGVSGAPRRTPPEAWGSFFNNARRAFGYEYPGDEGTAIAAANARMVGCDTRAAALAADISDC